MNKWDNMPMWSLSRKKALSELQDPSTLRPVRQTLWAYFPQWPNGHVIPYWNYINVLNHKRQNNGITYSCSHYHNTSPFRTIQLKTHFSYGSPGGVVLPGPAPERRPTTLFLRVVVFKQHSELNYFFSSL